MFDAMASAIRFPLSCPSMCDSRRSIGRGGRADGRGEKRYVGRRQVEGVDFRSAGGKISFALFFSRAR